MNEAIREAIRQAMREGGITQQALADRTGVSQGMVNQYLTGRRGKPADSFQAILDALNLELVVQPKEQK